MSRWAVGVDTVEELLTLGDLQRIQGAQTDGQPLLDKAVRTLASSAAIQDADPENGYTLAYDAARFACTALLAQQGLRPTTKGGHYAVERAMRAQFKGVFHAFGPLRRRRNELEYPTAHDVDVAPDEVEQARREADEIIEAAGKLLPHLSFF